MAGPFDEIVAKYRDTPSSGAFDDIVAKYKPVGVAEDMARSSVSGGVKGVSSVVGLPGFMYDVAGAVVRAPESVANFVMGRGYTSPVADRGEYKGAQDETQPETTLGKIGTFARGISNAIAPRNVMNYGNVKKGLENVVPGGDYKPQTIPGEYASTAAEFLPSMLFGGGGVGSRAVQALIPAFASETAGQVARQIAPQTEPYVRAGTAVATGLGTSLAMQPRTAEQAISRSMSNATPQQIQQAGNLIQDAAALPGGGVRLTWDEALQQVTNAGTNLGNLRRVVENSEGGGNVLKPLMSQRPGQVQATGGAVINNTAPMSLRPDRAGISNRNAAQGEIEGAQRAINDVTRPDYTAASRQRVGPQVQAALESDPIYAGTLAEIRSRPELNATIANLPNDSVEVIDLVQRRIREVAENARAPGQASTSNLAAVNLENARTPAITAAEQVTGGPRGDYARARATQQTLRQNLLEPLTEGQIGAVAGTTNLAQQGRAVLPNVPTPGTEGMVAETVGRLTRNDPRGAESLINSVVRGAFDEATQGLASGANQFGGAKFAAIVAGNGQQARNLEAAITALPNGDVRYQGFRRFLDVMEATGQRPQAGSMTSFNQELMRDLKQGNVLSTGLEASKTGGVSLLRRIQDFRDRLNLGNNTEQIARILSDPASGRLLEQLAREPAGSQRAAAIAARLTYFGQAASQPRNGTAAPTE
jgi:hypothetical protein